MVLGHWDFLRSTDETVGSYVARGAPDPTPLERQIPKFFTEWAKMAAAAVDHNKQLPRTETLPSGADRLKANLAPFFQYINMLIEHEVYG